MQNVWEWINNTFSKPAVVHSVPTFSPWQNTSHSEAFPRHKLVICYMTLPESCFLFLPEKTPKSCLRMLLILITEKFMLGLKETALELFLPFSSGWEQFKREKTSQITHMPAWYAWSSWESTLRPSVHVLCSPNTHRKMISREGAPTLRKRVNHKTQQSNPPSHLLF